VHACLDDLVTALYVTIDDLLGPRLGPGRPPKLSDAELVCLAVAQVLLGAHSERHWLRFASDRLGHLFPYLPGQAGNKRLRAAGHQLSLAIRHLAMAAPSWEDGFRLLDATPLPCGASRETVKRSALWPHAAYGYDRSHSRWYWGFKLYLLTAPDGMPITWCLATPKLGEREVAEVLLDDTARQQALAAGTIILADKGFAGQAFERHVAGLGAFLVRPDRKDEPRRFGPWAGCASGSSRSSTPSRSSSAWNSTVAASSAGSSSASASGCSPWPPRSGSTGNSRSRTSALWSPMTTDSPSTQSESTI
jgi:Transposase DDE domain